MVVEGRQGQAQRVQEPAWTTFQCDIPLRWGDMDAHHHVNNTVYFRLLEESRVVQFYGAREGTDRRYGLVLAHVSCDFLRQMHYPLTVRISRTVTRVGRSSMDVAVEIIGVDEPGLPYARGREVLVCMDFEAGRSHPWPQGILALVATSPV